jgi:transposase
MSWIKRVKRGNLIYLYECTSVRENGKVKSKLIRYLGVESDVPKVPKPKTKRVHPEQIYPTRSFRAGDVSLLWHIAGLSNMVNIIDRICIGQENVEGPTPGKFLTIWAINRALDPQSATQIESWVPSTILPQLAGIKPEKFTKDAFLSALDAICISSKTTGRVQSLIPQIEEVLYQKWRLDNPINTDPDAQYAFDLTPIISFSQTCPLSEAGYKTRQTKRLQINLSLFASKEDHYPIAHIVHPGSFQSITTVTNLIVRLRELAIPPGTIVWDRGNTSKKTIEEIESLDWNVICGVSKTLKQVREILAVTDPPIKPEYLVNSKAMNLYATKVDDSLYDNQGAVSVYTNIDRKISDLKKRNAAILEISHDLKKLENNAQSMSLDKLQSSIDEIMGEWGRFFKISINSGEQGIELIWEPDENERELVEKLDGKWLIYASDPSLTAEQVVKTYIEKDFIEKLFENIKSYEEIQPLRHRLESRVFAIIFVCTLALRLKAALRWIIHAKGRESNLSVEMLMKKLEHVEYVEFNIGDSMDAYFINMQKKTLKYLTDMGLDTVFKGKVKTL